MNPPIVLTIAGSDSGGGAGIQADIRTFALYGVLGASAVTAITAQNTVGVQQVAPIVGDVVAAQIESVMDDMPVVTVKTGMLATAEIVEIVARCELPNLVVDPVIVSSSGRDLLEPNAIDLFRTKLVPRAYVLTPNSFEASRLAGIDIEDVDDMKRAALMLQDMGAQTVVVTGSESGVDVVASPDEVHILRAKHVETRNTHGTGCIFSAAIACGIAEEKDVIDAVLHAKHFVHEGLVHGSSLHFGHGNGPVWPICHRP